MVCSGVAGLFACDSVTPRYEIGEPGTPAETLQVVAAPNVSLSVREHGGLAIGGVVSPTAELGWGDGPGERLLRF